MHRLINKKAFYLGFIIIFMLLVLPADAAAYEEFEETSEHVTRPYIAISRGPSFLGGELLAGIENARFSDEIDFQKATTGFTGISIGAQFHGEGHEDWPFSMELEAWGESGRVYSEGTIVEDDNTWEYDINYSSEALFTSFRLHTYYDLLPDNDRFYLMPSIGVLTIAGEWEIKGNASYNHVEGPYEEDIVFADDFLEIEDDEDDIAIGYSAGFRAEAFPLSWLGVYGEARYTRANFDDFKGDFAQFDFSSRYNILSLSGGIMVNITF